MNTLCTTTKQGVRQITLLGLAVLFMRASYPGGIIPELAFIAMVPLCLALHGLQGRSAFLTGWVYGFFIWVFCILWLPAALIAKLQAYPALIWGLFILSCALFALPYGAYALISCSLGWRGKISGALKSALSLTVFIALFPYLLPGNIAHALYSRPLLIQLADLGGVPLVLFAVVLINELIANAVLNRTRNRQHSLVALGVALMVVAAMIGYGKFRMSALETASREDDTPKIRIGAVQPNIPVDWGRKNLARAELLDSLFTQTAELSTRDNSLDLMVWPEIPIPLSYTENPKQRERVDQLVAETGVPLLMSSGYIYAYEPGREKRKGYYNAVEHITEQGQQGEYYKRRLSPFGEYLPFEEKFPWLRKFFPRAHYYVRGTKPGVFEVKSGIRAIPAMCYESIFSPLIHEAVNELGGNILVNPVNDGWFGNTAASNIHLALSMFRSVEYRIPMVRVANNGISSMITPTGVMEKTTRLFEKASISGTMVVNPGKTIYARYGKELLWTAGLLLLVLAVCDRRMLRGRP